MRIKEIEIFDFRSFKGNHTIDLTNSGKSLLIYGENGAGKSSICKAVDLFFESSDQRKKTLAIDNFSHLCKDNDFGRNGVYPFVNIEFTNNRNYTYGTDGHSDIDDDIKNGKRLKGSIDYKQLMPIYFTKKSRSGKINLYDFFARTALSDIRNPFTGKLIKTDASKKVKDLPDNFQKGVYSIVKELTDEVNTFLTYFDKDLKIEFTARRTFLTYEIYIEIILSNGYRTSEYSDYLNEARLVAIALSIHLAVISRYNRDKTIEREGSLNSPRVLLLDDVFIGMDLNNRLPFIKILKDHFGDYQKIMTTYDRAWFNLLKDQLSESEWKFIEVHEKNLNSSKSSIIVDENKRTYEESAKWQYDNFDYPACANYLRKAFEEILENKLPERFKYSVASNGLIERNKKTKTDYDRLIKFLNDSEIDTNTLSSFELYLRIIMNPLSHHDRESPIYRKELEKVFELLQLFKAISIVSIKDVSRNNTPILRSTYKDNDGNYHNYKFSLTESLYRVKFGDQIGYSPAKAIISAYKEPDSTEWLSRDDGPSYLKVIHHNLIDEHNAEESNYEEEMKTNKNRNLTQIGI